MNLEEWDEFRVNVNHWLELNYWERLIYLKRHSRNPTYLLGRFL